MPTPTATGRASLRSMPWRKARERCWRSDWVLDLDIKGFFDNIDWELMLKAVRCHTDCPWVLLYVERWLKAPVQMEDGCIVERTAGTPQGGVISPLLANLFLHYAFDMWMAREFPHIPFERYADDAICHCRTEAEARALRHALAVAVGGLQVDAASGEDENRLLQGRQSETRLSRHPLRLSGLPVPSPQDDVDGEGRARLHAQASCLRPARKRSCASGGKSAAGRCINAPTNPWKSWLRCTIRQFAAGSPTTATSIGRSCDPTLYKIDAYVVRWARRKYKRMARRPKGAKDWLARLRRASPRLFAHWPLCHGNGRTSGAV